jgi:hypothetical protein
MQKDHHELYLHADVNATYWEGVGWQHWWEIGEIMAVKKFKHWS